MKLLKRRKSSKKKKEDIQGVSLDDYLECIEAGVIPSAPPLVNATFLSSLDSSLPSNYFTEQWNTREFCTSRGLWTIIDQIWSKKLAKWIKNKKCLEVMAGGGWLAKALSDDGIDIIATDDKSWGEKQHSKIIYVCPVEEIGAIEAVKKYTDRDVLIISWPPYESEIICNVCDVWGSERPIIYIGEGDGGCCAPETFWEHFDEINKVPQIPLAQWFGIHDFLTIGYWRNPKRQINNSIDGLEI